MRLLLMLCLTTLFTGCQKDKIPSNGKTKSKTRMQENTLLIQSKLEPNKCDKALEEVPVYKKSKKGMFKDIFNFYKKHYDCMDAGVATNIQVVVTSSLSSEWKDLKDLNEFILMDSKFEKFILLNIDSLVTGLSEEVRHIERLSRENCPATFEKLCEKINTAANDALIAEKEEG